MRVRLRVVSGVALLAAVLGGCGGASDNGVSSKSPDQVLAAVRQALGGVHSFHVKVHSVDTDGPSDIEGDVKLPGQIHLTGGLGDQHLELVVTGGTVYIKANASFYQHNGGGEAGKLFADKWVILPAEASSSIADLEAIADPSKLADCLVGGPHGTLSKEGADTVAGTPVVVIADKGNVAGDAPGRLYVATTGPAYPVRAQQTGPVTGGSSSSSSSNSCGTGSDTTTSSDTLISRINESVTITAPKDAIDISKLVGPGA